MKNFFIYLIIVLIFSQQLAQSQEIEDKNVLIVWGGWEGHNPEVFSDIVEDWSIENNANVTVNMFELVYSTSPITVLLPLSTTVTDGNIPKLWVMVHLARGASWQKVKVPESAIISAKSSIVQTLLGVAGQDMLDCKLTLANGSTNIPSNSVATTTLVDAAFCQSHNPFSSTALAKSV